jgi:hypothetical protein
MTTAKSPLRLLMVALLAALGSPAFAADTRAGADTQQEAGDRLRPGQFEWMPEASAAGPVVIVVSLPEQMAHVYRGGVRIARTTISSGKPGHETPTGVFPILQKRRVHHSNLYNNAPMPYMQRLTWDGVALHAGQIPGHPASHGCIRLPREFAEKLFELTEHGVNVVVADEGSHSHAVLYPGDSAPVNAITGLEPLRDMAPIAQTATSGGGVTLAREAR